MIRFDGVTFTYDGAKSATLRDLHLEVPEAEMCLVVGPTGSGKSTLLGLVNGLVPHLTGGTLAGDVRVDGRSIRTSPPRELADVVGYVGQDPASGFVTDTVEDELAYTMENLGVPRAAMRRRVEETLDLLGLHPVRARLLRTLSGGQQQRVAIGSVLTAAPRVLVLDEPTSALDPIAAEEVLATLARLVHDVGLTVVVAEHRLERVLPFADRLVIVPGAEATVRSGEPAALISESPVVPPIVELAGLAGWRPPPLRVRDARRLAGPLRARLGAPPADARVAPSAGPVTARTKRASVTFGSLVALRDASLDLHEGSITALMGRNGSGKSTLLSLLAGIRAPTRGAVEVEGRRPTELSAQERTRLVGLVPQRPELLLSEATVAAECSAADAEGHLEAGSTGAVLDELQQGVDRAAHPRDLSEGQRLVLALAVVLAHRPRLVLLDEPTRGLDYTSKAHLEGILRRLAAAGATVAFATHDVEIVARVADRSILLADGEVVADGHAREVVGHSPGFAPQVAKVLAPDPWLTIDEVRTALDASTVSAS